MGMHQGWRLVLLVVNRQVHTWDLLRVLEVLLRVLHLFLHHIVREEVPEVQADLEELFVRDAAHLGQVGESMQCLIPQHLDLLVWLDSVGERLNEVNVISEH